VRKKNTRKADRNCTSWVVIGTTIICTERSQQDLIITSIKRTIQLAVMQPPLARGHVLMELPLLRNSHLFLEDIYQLIYFIFINLHTIQYIIYILLLTYYRISNTDTNKWIIQNKQKLKLFLTLKHMSPSHS
jgi:hypothetical protein